MTAPRHIRVSGPLDTLARREVIRTYARAYDDWATEEQRLWGENKPIEAEGARRQSDIILRAYRAEFDDPEVGS